MKASMLIENLTKLIDKHGDLPIMDEYNNNVDGLEYNDEAVRCFLLLITGVTDDEGVSG